MSSHVAGEHDGQIMDSKRLARNRAKFIDQAIDNLVGETLKMKKEHQFDYLVEELTELCAVAHFVDHNSNVDDLIEAWAAASLEDRRAPPEAVLVETAGSFPTDKIIDKILRRTVGAVRSLPLFRAHKPMFAPYPHEITGALQCGVHDAFKNLLNKMVHDE